MVKLIVGVKGTGKTKLLINMVNDALEKTNGSVVCVEKGSKLIHEVKYQARLIDSDEFMITDAHALFGFISGICASNHDVTDVFVDGTLKICQNNPDELVQLIRSLMKLDKTLQVNFVLTVSMPVESIPEEYRELMIEH